VAVRKQSAERLDPSLRGAFLRAGGQREKVVGYSTRRDIVADRQGDAAPPLNPQLRAPVDVAVKAVPAALVASHTSPHPLTASGWTDQAAGLASCGGRR